jgi:ATP-dependent helicase/nuclease subunit A
MSRDRAYKRVEDLEGAQRAAATAEGDVVVAAGAGSGKTTVLAARYVRLLEEGRALSGERLRPRNVLVLTFTRKAAAEMYSRIYGAL